MILVDTSVWIDHFRSADPHLAVLLENDVVCTHGAVIGEVLLGNLGRRHRTVAALLTVLATSREATHAETRSMIDTYGMSGTGVGYVDAQLLASALADGHRLWTRDQRLHRLSAKLNVDHSP